MTDGEGRCTDSGAEVSAEIEGSDTVRLTVDDHIHASSQWLTRTDAKALALFLYKWAEHA